MFKFNFFKRKKPALSTSTKFFGLKLPKTGRLVENHLEIRIKDILITIERSSGILPQNELTAVIPRAEIRRKRFKNGQLVDCEEIILSSLTLTDSPHYLSEKKQGLTGHPAPPLPAPFGTPAPPR